MQEALGSIPKTGGGGDPSQCPALHHFRSASYRSPQVRGLKTVSKERSHNRI